MDMCLPSKAIGTSEDEVRAIKEFSALMSPYGRIAKYIPHEYLIYQYEHHGYDAHGDNLSCQVVQIVNKPYEELHLSHAKPLDKSKGYPAPILRKAAISFNWHTIQHESSLL